MDSQMTTLLRSVLLLCLVWIGGCTAVGTGTPITDPSVPADQQLIGSWVQLCYELALYNVVEDKEYKGYKCTFADIIFFYFQLSKRRTKSPTKLSNKQLNQ